jgi:hypothetical protein
MQNSPRFLLSSIANRASHGGRSRGAGGRRGPSQAESISVASWAGSCASPSMAPARRLRTVNHRRTKKKVSIPRLTKPPICAWKPFGTETGRISGQCCDEEDEQRREARLFFSRPQSASGCLDRRGTAGQRDVSPMTWWSSRLFASHIKDVTALGEVSSGLTHRTTPPCRSVSPQGRQLVEHAQGLSAERVPGLPHCPECINSVAENNNKRAVACMFCSRDVKRKFIIKSLKRVTIAPAQVFTRVPGCNPICLVSPAAADRCQILALFRPWLSPC